MTQRNWSDELDRTPAVATVQLVKPGTVGPVAGGLVYQRMYEWISYPIEAPAQKYRDDPGDIEEAIKERPATWWSPRSIGFRAKILVNPLGGELRIRERKLASWLSGITDEKDYLEVIADSVIAWDYVIIDGDGTRVEVEAPAVGGWERFLDLPSEAYTWLTMEIRTAHLPKAPTSGTPLSKSAGTLESENPMPASPESPPLES